MMDPVKESYTLDLYAEIAELQAQNAALLEALEERGSYYTQALYRIIELEDQLRDAPALLRKTRDVLEIVWDTQIHNDIQVLIAEIDLFLPQGE